MIEKEAKQKIESHFGSQQPLKSVCVCVFDF